MFELEVKKVMARVLQKNLEELDDSFDIIEDVRADSIQIVELVCAIEDEFNIKIEDSELINYRNIGDICSKVASLM